MVPDLVPEFIFIKKRPLLRGLAIPQIYQAPIALFRSRQLKAKSGDQLLMLRI